MRKSIMIVILAVLAWAVSACGTAPTGDTANDAGAAQRYLPTVAGFNAAEATSITAAFEAVPGGSDLLNSNRLISAAVGRIDSLMSCYRNVGAVSARVYTPSDMAGVVLRGEVPAVGVVAVINQDRLRENLAQCVAQGEDGRMSAQGADSVCIGGNTVEANGETITYIFAATNQTLCDSFNAQLPG
jgi:hypothetical protein